MTSNRRFSDEELTCYLDGEADPEMQRAIEETIARDETQAERLRTLAVDTTEIKSGFTDLLASAPNPPSAVYHAQSEPSANQLTFNYFRAAAIACLIFGLGALIGRVVTLSERPDWRDYAAKYHALYVTDTLAVVQTDNKSLVTSLARAQSALKHQLDKEKLSSVAGLALKRSQILGFEGRPLIQLAYLTSAGAPVALCIIPNSTATDASPTVRSMEGLAAASWSKEGYEFLLIGGRNENFIRDAARTFHQKL